MSEITENLYPEVSQRAKVKENYSRRSSQTRTEKLNAGPDVVSQRPPPESVDLQNLDPTIAYTRAKPLGRLRTYGILVGTIHDGEINLNGKPLRYEIWVKADADYRIAIHVQSVDGSDLLVFFDPDFANPTKLDLPTRRAVCKGFTPLATGREGQGLDYLRNALFPLGSMASAPAEGQGNSLANLLDAQIGRAKEDDDAVVLVCGELFRITAPIRPSPSRPNRVSMIFT